MRLGMTIDLLPNIIKTSAMNFLKSNILFLGVLLSLLVFTSCNKDDDDDTPQPVATQPVIVGSSVTVNNTFQSTAFTSDAELPIEELFMMPQGALFASANVGSGIEFPAYLLNLYDIDIAANTITFEVVAESDDPTYGDLFRVLEADTYDRYYFTFDAAQNVNGFTSNNSSVNLRIDSNQVLVVEVGEGFDFQPGASFTITLN